MGADVLKNANAMPAPTWHRLHMNDVDIELPQVPLEPAHAVAVEADPALFGAEDAFDQALAELQTRLDAARAAGPADTRAVLHAIDGSAEPSNLDVPALSAYEDRAVREEVANDVAAAFECGMGAEAEHWMVEKADRAGRPLTLATAEGQNTHATVRITGHDGMANVADLAVVAAPGSRLDLTVVLDSPATGTGVVGSRLRVFAGRGAQVNVTATQTLDDTWVALENEGYVLDEGARVNVRHRVLGAGASYTGLACDLRGDSARADIDTRYLGHRDNIVDFNYVVRHRGKKTICNINANGVLMDQSKKTLRGTIDLVHGCKGSEGAERETVLLADERVENLTIPVILCDEDDVAGNHGATIGHVRPEQLNYLASRGISPEAAEGLFATATLEETAINVPNAAVRAGVARLAQKLGIPYEADDLETEAAR